VRVLLDDGGRADAKAVEVRDKDCVTEADRLRVGVAEIVVAGAFKPRICTPYRT
jgi:hypothetical protein